MSELNFLPVINFCDRWWECFDVVWKILASSTSCKTKWFTLVEDEKYLLENIPLPLPPWVKCIKKASLTKKKANWAQYKDARLNIVCLALGKRLPPPLKQREETLWMVRSYNTQWAVTSASSKQEKPTRVSTETLLQGSVRMLLYWIASSHRPRRHNKILLCELSGSIKLVGGR